MFKNGQPQIETAQLYSPVMILNCREKSNIHSIYLPDIIYPTKSAISNQLIFISYHKFLYRYYLSILLFIAILLALRRVFPSVNRTQYHSHHHPGKRSRNKLFHIAAVSSSCNFAASAFLPHTPTLFPKYYHPLQSSPHSTG